MSKGFHNSRFHNYTFDPEVFSDAEQQFRDLIRLLGLKESEFLHEKPVKVKINGRKRTWHFDFYHIPTRTRIEINPDWHYNYIPVIQLDALKNEVLRDRFNMESLEVKVTYDVKTKKNSIVMSDALKALEIVCNKPKSPETLSFYC